MPNVYRRVGGCRPKDRTGHGAIAAAVAVTAIAVPAASAGADKYNTVKIDSEVTLAVDGASCTPEGQCSAEVFHGWVTSSKHACEVQRTVKVFKYYRSPDHPDKLVRKDMSNDRGSGSSGSTWTPGADQATSTRRCAKRKAPPGSSAAAIAPCSGTTTEPADRGSAKDAAARLRWHVTE